MSDSVSVPDVLDETTADAQRALAAVGLTLGTISTEKNPGGIPGTVLRTSPDTGSLVPQGSAIDLVIIEAADALAVPNVVGLTQPMAEQQLTQAGLRVGAVATEKIAPVLPWEKDSVQTPPLGTVVRTSPPAGGQAAPNSGVDLVIAEEAELVAMPNVIGQNLPPVIDFLTERGQTVDVYLIDFTDRDNPVNLSLQGRKLDLWNKSDSYQIIHQDPEAGYDLRGSQRHTPPLHIHLYVKEGFGPLGPV